MTSEYLHLFLPNLVSAQGHSNTSTGKKDSGQHLLPAQSLGFISLYPITPSHLSCSNRLSKLPCVMSKHSSNLCWWSFGSRKPLNEGPEWILGQCRWEWRLYQVMCQHSLTAAPRWSPDAVTLSTASRDNDVAILEHWRQSWSLAVGRMNVGSKRVFEIAPIWPGEKRQTGSCFLFCFSCPIRGKPTTIRMHCACCLPRTHPPLSSWNCLADFEQP